MVLNRIPTACFGETELDRSVAHFIRPAIAKPPKRDI
jgi:hypothetical protein